MSVLEPSPPRAGAAGGRLAEPPKVSGGDGPNGHLEELRHDPIGLMNRVRAECGDVGELRLAGKEVVLLTDAQANEAFFRAGDDELDQAAAYPFMKPIFGEGVVFDATPEQRREALHNQALRDKFMRGHAATIAAEVDAMVAGWDDRANGGEIDLLDWFAELTIYTSSACLIGKRFRHQLDRRFADLYHDLERGTDAVAFVDPYAPIESFRRRDAARAGLVELVEAIMATRLDGPPPPPEERDLLDVLVAITDEAGRPRFSADTVTGMFISMMFAGHHTTSGTAAWTLIELLRHPDALARVTAELDGLFADSDDVSYQALREMPHLEAAIKEALRLHPPLILLLRVATADVEVGGVHIAAGKLVGASPAVSNRIPEAFDEPDAFVPERYIAPREDDRANPWNWIPFGAGRHRCVGAAFAMMQLKAIFSVLLHHWTFELAQPSDTYRNDHSKMVVQLAQPCAVRYRRRSPDAAGPSTAAGCDAIRSSGAAAEDAPASSSAAAAELVNGDGGRGAEGAGMAVDRPTAGPAPQRFRIVVDRDLCQGHGVCEAEAPGVFAVSKKGEMTILDETPASERRAAVEAAVHHCPTHALSIVELPGGEGSGGTRMTS